MFLQRVITACVGIPIAIYLINYGGLPYAAAITLIAILAWYEYCKMMACKQIAIPFVVGLVGLLLVLLASWFGNINELLGVIFFTYLIFLSIVVLCNCRYTITTAAYAIMGISYIALPFAHLLLLRLTDTSLSLPSLWGTSLSAGAVYLWLAFLGTWANDTFAYFVGTKWGKHKLCPAISPGKTKEGALGGVAGSILVIMAFGTLYYLPFTHLFAIGLLVGVAAPLGDLTESALKRYTGVKDSGRILPGHGGVLDRFDSIMFAVPVVYYYVRMFILG